MTSISDTNVVNAPGGLVELAYSQITSPVTISGTTGTPQSVISPMTVVCDGSPIMVEFYAPYFQYPSSAGNWGGVSLYVDGSLECYLTENLYTSSALGNIDLGPISTKRRLTPAAGVRTFEIRAWRNIANITIGAGTGGGGNVYAPAFLRVSKIIQASQLIVQTPNAPLVTSLPSNAIDGQEVRYLADNTNGVVWNLRYRAGSSSSYKWEFIGGSPFQSPTVTTAGNGGASTGIWSSMPVTPVSRTAPLSGDYLIEWGAGAGWCTTAGQAAYLNFSVNNNTPNEYDSILFETPGGETSSIANAASLKRVYSNISANQVIELKFKATSGTWNWRAYFISIIPIRVSA